MFYLMLFFVHKIIRKFLNSKVNCTIKKEMQLLTYNEIKKNYIYYFDIDGYKIGKNINNYHIYLEHIFKLKLMIFFSVMVDLSLSNEFLYYN